MKIIYNNILPPKGFKAINLFGVLFVRKDVEIYDTTLNHEAIHTAQMKEMLYIFFYLWYFFEWLYRLVWEVNAYRSISFEREAYENEDDISYLIHRKPFSWWKYL